jgi:hypothetical protein
MLGIGIVMANRQLGPGHGRLPNLAVRLSRDTRAPSQDLVRAGGSGLGF